MRISKINSILLLQIMLLTMLVGCGEADGQSVQPEQPEEQAQWKTQGFAISTDSEEASELRIQQYEPWEHSAAFDAEAGENRSAIDSGSCADQIWWLSEIDVQESYKEWVLEIYDTVTGEWAVKKFSHEQLGVEEDAG